MTTAPGSPPRVLSTFLGDSAVTLVIRVVTISLGVGVGVEGVRGSETGASHQGLGVGLERRGVCVPGT